MKLLLIAWAIIMSVGSRRLQMMNEDGPPHVYVHMKGMDEPLRIEIEIPLNVDDLKDKILIAADLSGEYKARLKVQMDADPAIFHCELAPRIGRRRIIQQRQDIDEAQMDGPEMLIYAQLTGMGMDERIPIELSIHSSIGNLKNKIAQQAELSHGQKKRLKISFGGIELNDPNELLSDAGICAESTIDCHIKANRGPKRTMIPLRDEDCYDAVRDFVDVTMCINKNADVKQRREKRVTRCTQLVCAAGCLYYCTPLGPCTTNADFAKAAHECCFSIDLPLALKEAWLYGGFRMCKHAQRRRILQTMRFLLR